MAADGLTLEVIYTHLVQEARDTRADIRALRDDIHQIDRRMHSAERSLQDLAERSSKRSKARRQMVIAGAAAVIGRSSDQIVSAAAAILPHAPHHH